ncbi:hypothetical protein [Flavobacterium sp.]|uniref:hypothetical protein n=1 Tax=Flavobacterium sp. TaxID=239 RepID=UPI00261BD020|nr:hypothetical protein [Flavobacterium sp.]
MVSLAEIKNWFKTGLKPTQIQFWAVWESFWHKDEMIPQSKIQNLIIDLDNKAEKGSGSRFGIEDRNTPDDINGRTIDMNQKNMVFDHVGDFRINNYIPYGYIEERTAQDEGLVILENDEESWTCTIYRADGSSIGYTPDRGYMYLLLSENGEPYTENGFYANYDSNTGSWTYTSHFLSGGTFKYQGYVGEKYADIIAGIPPVMGDGMGSEVVVVEGDRLRKTSIADVLPVTTLNDVTKNNNISKKSLIVSQSGTAGEDDNYAEYHLSGYRMYGGYSREPKFDVYIGLQHEMGSAFKGRHFYVWPASPRRNEPGSNPYIIPITVNGKAADKEGNITIDGGGGSASSTWGSIGGDIGTQSDLVDLVNGSKFGVGDATMDDDRWVDMANNSFTYSSVGSFALLGNEVEINETNNELRLEPIGSLFYELLNRTVIRNEWGSPIANSKKIDFELTITESEGVVYTDYYTFIGVNHGEGGTRYHSDDQLWEEGFTVSIEPTGNYRYRIQNYADVRMQVPSDSGEPGARTQRVMLMNESGKISQSSEALVLKDLSRLEVRGQEVYDYIWYQNFGEYANIEIRENETGNPDFDHYTFLRLNIDYDQFEKIGDEVLVRLEVEGTLGDYPFRLMNIGEDRIFAYDAIIGTNITPIWYRQPFTRPVSVVMDLQETNMEYFKNVITDDDGNLYKMNASAPGLNAVLTTNSNAPFQSITLNNTKDLTVINPLPYTFDPGGMMVKSTTDNLAETFYKRDGISVQNAASGNVNLNFPTSSSNAATYNINLPERNGTLATTDQIPVVPPTPGLQEVMTVNSVASKRGLVRMESKSNDQIEPGLAYGSAKLDLHDSGVNTNAELYVRDYFGFETFLRMGAMDGDGNGIQVNAYNYGLRNVTDHSDSEFDNDLNYVTAGGVKKYIANSLDKPAPTSQTDLGEKGEIRLGASYLYLCTSTNNWIRIPFISGGRWD